MINPKSLTIIGTGAVVPLGVGGAKWVMGSTGAGNAFNVVFGGSEVVAPGVSPATVGVGFPLPPGWAGVMFPPIAESFSFYDLSQIMVGLAVGDVLYIAFGG